ncbi:MAG: hypothetical protein LUI39_10515 [Lachnospiraceae bacterium]|nr:hypothetical protein [Lachnospiraceae bacterium]
MKTEVTERKSQDTGFGEWSVRILMLLMLSVLISFCVPYAQTGMSTVSAEETVTTGWKTKSKKVYYYKSDGKKATGLVTIDGKKYYFNSKGVQRTGWQKIGSSYYYFKLSNGSGGYMVKSTKINGVTISKSGKATFSGKNKTKLKNKVKVMVKANKLVEAATKPTQTKAQKLKACFQYLIKNYKYKGSPIFNKTNNWAVDNAASLFANKHGSCYEFGAAFAFIANAVGYKNCYAVSSGGHGWAEINGKVYDPTWEITDTRYSYYAVPMSLSGVGGRPNYKKYGYYKVKI